MRFECRVYLAACSPAAASHLTDVALRLCDYFQGYELVLPAKSTDFNEIWKQRMTGFDLGKRKQGEAIAYRLGRQSIARHQRRKERLDRSGRTQLIMRNLRIARLAWSAFFCRL